MSRLDLYDKRIKSLQKVQKECSEICDIYKKTKRFLLRGSNNTYYGYQYLTPREDRRPKDMDSTVHKLLDDAFHKLYGWKPRSQGVFCTSDIMEVSNNYGLPYIIFPVNGFKYIWSSSIEDLYGNEFDSVKWNEMSYNYWQSKHKSSGPVKQTIAGWTKDLKKEQAELEDWHTFLIDKIQTIVLKYQDTNIEEAIRKRNEVSLKCKGYYMAEYEENVTEIMDALGMEYDI